MIIYLSIHLFFSDPPSVTLSVLQPHSSNTPLTLYCDVESFYPEEMSVSWLQNGTVLPDPPTTEENLDGTYRTRRYYTLSTNQREQAGKVECAVHQPGAVQPVRSSAYLEKLDPRGKIQNVVFEVRHTYCKFLLVEQSHSTESIFQEVSHFIHHVCGLSLCLLLDEPPLLTKSAKASVALMCISLVLVFLLCFGFSWRRRDGESERHRVRAQCASQALDSNDDSFTVWLICSSSLLLSLISLSPLFLSSLRETEVSECVRDYPPTTPCRGSKGQGHSEHWGQEGGPGPDCMVP